MKKILILALALFTMSFMNTGSYAFLSSKTSNENNIVTTGNFPKIRVSVYSATGPVFKETTEGSENQQSQSYPAWFGNASKFIIKDLTGQILDVPAPQNEYERFQSASVTGEHRKNTMVSSNFYSWKGVELKDGSKEHGTTMHYIVAIENSNRYGQGSPKIALNSLKIDDVSVSVNQYDVFRSMSSGKEYVVQRGSEAFKPGEQKNRTRVWTFNWINGSYVRAFNNTKGITINNQSSNGDNPADEADLILFDVGSEGYYASVNNVENLTNQQALDKLYDRLCGREPHASLINGKYTVYYQNPSPIYSTVQSMITNNDLKCRLDRGICKVQILRGGTPIYEEVSTINFVD